LQIKEKYFEDVEIPTDFLQMQGGECIDGVVEYFISHVSSVDEWTQWSTMFLGEIVINYEDRPSATLLVYVESSNQDRQSVVTAINPNFCDIRIKPYEIIEVVLYYPQFFGEETWSWQWMPLEKATLECIGNNSVSPAIWEQYADVISIDPEYLYTPHPRFKESDSRFREFHYWFRCDESVLPLLGQGKDVSMGMLTFEGKLNDEVSAVYYNLSVYVDCNSKYRARTLKTLDVTKQQSLQPQTVFCGRKKTQQIRRIVLKPLKTCGFAQGCRVFGNGVAKSSANR
jgi:hypothetical protein